MARTAVVSIKIRNNGTPLGVVGFTTIDLTGTLTGSDEGNGVVNIAGAGGGVGTNVSTQVVTAVQSGSDVTIDLTQLTHPFSAIEIVSRNGQILTPIAYWSISGNTITIPNADAGDSYVIQYTW